MTDLIARVNGSTGHLSLNRPSAIHALTLDMIQAMTRSLLDWRGDPSVEAIIIDHADGRGFCSGGDINLLRHSALYDGGASGRAFFFEEYRLNHLMFTYAKPIIAFMDGITMGGGVGISQPARFRIATENTRFAMPETGIGLFPDVGGGWYLSRLPGRVGEYLGLTGARMDGADCHALGIATHYLSADSQAEAKARIAADPDAVTAILADLSSTPPVAALTPHRSTIDRLFAAERLEDILAALEADGGEWAMKQHGIIRSKSPQSCKVTLRQLRESRACADFAANMAMEYRIASRVLTLPDFAEGVRALIVDKDNAPAWNPATPEGVTDDLIDSIFAPLPADEEWTPL